MTKTFIIAEIGSNHNQNIRTAKKLIEISKASGADAVKFQSIQLNEIYTSPPNLPIDLDESWYPELISHCQKCDITFFSAPTYLRAVDILEEHNVELYKIASPQTATFPQLIEKVAKTGKPIIMSTGYCTIPMIDRAVNILKKHNSKFSLLHCVSVYPPRFEELNLGFIQTLKNRYNVPVGFSDHTDFPENVELAIASGAEIIEKHITLDSSQGGPDHFFSLEPFEFEKMVGYIRKMERVMQKERVLTQDEINFLSKIKMYWDEKLGFKRDIYGVEAWEKFESH